MNGRRGAATRAPRFVRAVPLAALLPLAVVAACGPGPALAEPATLRYEGSFGYASGSYLFDQIVTSWTLTNGVALQHARWSARVSVPVHLQSSVVTNTGAGALPGGGPLQGDVASQGRGRSAAPGVHRPGHVGVPDSIADERRVVAGDPILSLSATPLAGGTGSFSLGLAAKAPLASEEDYGTGAWDWGGTAGLLLAPGGGTMLSADVSYWILGDLDSLAFRDPFTGSLTLAKSVGPDLLAALTISAGTTAISGYDGPVTAGLLFTRTRNGRSLSAGVTVGFTETAADAVATISWSLPLTRR
ncbi:MAG TPA: hypothetical protein VFT32_01290 [Candidatus Eisenbacteria bacterium]|nr:hypothetical protein [Candidatus Eisenbacteria bacterium]